MMNTFAALGCGARLGMARVPPAALELPPSFQLSVSRDPTGNPWSLALPTSLPALQRMQRGNFPRHQPVGHLPRIPAHANLHFAVKFSQKGRTQIGMVVKELERRSHAESGGIDRGHLPLQLGLSRSQKELNSAGFT